jgi:hypothetical protein
MAVLTHTIVSYNFPRDRDGKRWPGIFHRVDRLHSKDPGPEDPALVHPGFRLVEPKSLQLGERGDGGDNFYQQCSGVGCQVSATEVDPLDRSRS